jgi:hypothetical protein
VSVTLLEPEPVKMQHGFKLIAGSITPSPLTARKEDVIQGDIAACPIAAVMVAMAQARPSNLNRILGAPIRGTVISKRRDREIFDLWSEFYYDVTFPGRGTATRISPQVYAKDGSVKYARTPTGAGWPSYIEKAYAVWKSRGGQGGSGGDYTRLDLRVSLLDPPSLNEVMNDLIGKIDVLDHKQACSSTPTATRAICA